MIKQLVHSWQKTGWGAQPFFWFDSTILAIALPFLLFPTRFPLATLIALLLLLVKWGVDLRFLAAKRLVSPFTVVILAFGLCSLLPLIVTADPDLTLEKGAGLLLGLSTLIWFLQHVRNSTALNWSTWLFIGLGCGFVGIGFLAVDWLDKIPALTNILTFFPQRIISFTAIGSGQGVQPNQLAGTIVWVFPLPLLLGLTFWHKKRRWTALFLFAIGIILIAILVLTQSRGGWLGGCAALGVGLWLATFGRPQGDAYQRMRWGWPLLALISFVLLFIVLGPEQLFNLWIDPPDETLVGDLGTLSFRQEVWTWALIALEDFPFTGTGLGTFRRVVHRLYPISIPVTYDIAHAHNVFLQIGLDFGIPGLIAYLALIGITFSIGLQHIISEEHSRLLNIAILMAMTGFHAYGLVDTISIGAKPGLLFWVLLGMLASNKIINGKL